jgi:hypothetical protein
MKSNTEAEVDVDKIKAGLPNIHRDLELACGLDAGPGDVEHARRVVGDFLREFDRVLSELPSHEREEIEMHLRSELNDIRAKYALIKEQ